MTGNLSTQEVQDMQKRYAHVLNGTGVPYPLQRVLDAAEDVVKISELQYKALCPCHDDGSPSLNIKYDDKTKKVLLKCFVCGKEKGYTDFLTAWGIDPLELIMPQQRHISSTYDYTDESGNLLYQNVRYVPKDFRPRRPDGEGGWIWNLKNTRRVLYNLPNLIGVRPGKPIFFTEGEKDADTLLKYGYLATTSGSATSWCPEFAEYLTGREVVILPHNDSPGSTYANIVAHDLFKIVKSIKIVNLPVKHGEDVTDYFEQGGTVEQFNELVKETPVLNKTTKQKRKHAIYEGINNMEAKETHWLWENRIPLGMLSLLIGNQDVGKSVLSLFMAGIVSTGDSWPDVPNRKVPVGSVIILSSEDDKHRTIKPRLEATGVDGNKVFFLASLTEQLTDGQTKTRGLSNLTTDLDVLDDAICRIGDVRLVIIDPITAFAGGKKENSNAGVREFLDPLIELAASRNVAIVGLSHLNKDAQKEAAHRTLGSVAWTAAARAVWLVAFDPKIDGRRLFVPVKCNLAQSRTGLAFTLVNTDTVVAGKSCGFPVCKFEAGVVEMTPDDALDSESRKKAVKKVDLCVEWLEEFLMGGPRMTKDILDAGRQNSMSESTINRAKAKLSIKATQLRDGDKILGWEWELRQ